MKSVSLKELAHSHRARKGQSHDETHFDSNTYDFDILLHCFTSAQDFCQLRHLNNLDLGDYH